jgi:prolyl-tRNA synthetase
MNCVYLDEKGQPAPMQMGCYGIGVTRILGAAIEQNFDDKASSGRTPSRRSSWCCARWAMTAAIW